MAPAWAQAPSGGHELSAEQLDEALERYFSSDSTIRAAGLVFIAATRVGPAFRLPTDESPQSLALVDRLANPAIRAPLTIETVDSIYDYILTFRELPLFQYSREDQRDFKRLNGILFKRRFFICVFIDSLTGQSPPREPSRAYTRYFEFAQRVAEAKDRYNAAKAGQEDSRKLAELQNELDWLEEWWRTAGRKNEIEQAMAEYGRLTAKNPVNIWNKLETKYKSALLSVGSSRIPKTELDPRVPTWADNAGWEQLRIAVAGGGAITIRIKTIQIRRPWLEEQIFGGLAWRWIRSAPLGQGHIVADGKGLATVMSKSKTISLMPRQLVIGTYATDRIKWPESAFLAGYLASIVPATPSVDGKGAIPTSSEVR